MASICKSLNVQRLYVFGSVVTDDFSDSSDIDFLLAFPEEMTVEDYTDNYFKMHEEFGKLLQRDIDIVTERSLSNPYFIERLNQTKELVYAA